MKTNFLRLIKQRLGPGNDSNLVWLSLKPMFFPPHMSSLYVLAANT